MKARCEKEKLYEKLRHLGRREHKIIELRYGLPYGHKRTQREIAHILGISRSYVSRIEKRALTKLCQELIADEGSVIRLKRLSLGNPSWQQALGPF